MQLCLHICLQSVSTVTGTLVNDLRIAWIPVSKQLLKEWKTLRATLSIMKARYSFWVLFERTSMKAPHCLHPALLGRTSQAGGELRRYQPHLYWIPGYILFLLVSRSKLQSQLHNKWAETISTNSQAKNFQATQPLLGNTSACSH